MASNSDQSIGLRAREGAHKVLSECVNLKSGDVLALFWDETTSEAAEVLLEVAQELGVKVRSRYVLTDEQAQFPASGSLGLEDMEALANSRSIITCLSNMTRSTGYRRELVRTGTNRGKRFGHMPGANLSVLANALNIDYASASSRCDNLALALTLGQVAQLRTYVLDESKKPVKTFDLHLQLGGVIRSPITSTGMIPLGTWGNLPGGETFIAPIEDTAEGVFVLNGAFTDYVLTPPAHLLLHFSQGRLVNVEGTRPEVEHFNGILTFAKNIKDPYYDSLAELGIGVNTGIRELTGNALFDEKCYGTAHIAIGDNATFGGNYSSRIHEDLITRAPSLWIDGKSILNEGLDSLNPLEWRESLSNTVLGFPQTSSDFVVTRTAINTESGTDGTLLVRRSVTAGRICIYTVAEQETSKILAQIYSKIPYLPREIKFNDLSRVISEDLALTSEVLKAALAILERHEIINVRNI